MRVEILGSAAGGGFPQWNCACRNCSSLRAGSFRGKARSQLQVAISSEGRSWFLLNASPDLRGQIEANSCLHPRDGLRQSPISGVALTSAELDQVLGLLLLRELQPLQIFATPSVRQVVRDDNRMFAMLQRVPNQAQWTDIIPDNSFVLASAGGEKSKIRCLPIPLTSRYPSYVPSERAAGLKPGEALLGLIIGTESDTESGSGGRLACFPAVPRIDDALLQQLESLKSTDLLLFDGTFWSDDELIQIQGTGQTAREMGHIPVSSARRKPTVVGRVATPQKNFRACQQYQPYAG